MAASPNIVWVLVDSVRSYHSEGDDRGKLPFMDRFGEHSVEFLNVVTSAPSTIMAVSAMMTSLPSYLIARNYDDFLFDNQYFNCLNDILKHNGYHSMAFFRHPHPRDKFHNLLDPVPHKFWLPHLKHEQIWSNEELAQVLNNALDSPLPQPAFLFIHFTCRRDSNTSDIVESSLQDLNRAGFAEDNSIFIICSDHGYPDPSRGFTPEGLKRQHLSHDLILTDDNIKIPLYIKYPGCKAKKISATVSSLDIMPTVLELAGINLDDDVMASFHGASLKSLLVGNTAERPGNIYVRSDARLLYQTGRITAIRNNSYKYLRFHDRQASENEELFDLVNDPLEGNNIAQSDNPVVPAILNDFRKEFERQEQVALRQQVGYVLKRFTQQAHKLNLSQSTKENPGRVIILIEPQTGAYADLTLEVIHEAWPSSEIDLLTYESETIASKIFSRRYQYNQADKKGYQLVGEHPTTKYDVQLVYTINPAKTQAKELFRLSKSIKATNTLIVDCNVNAYHRDRYLYHRMKDGLSRLKNIKNEPFAVFSFFSKGVRVIKKRLAL